ncbi:MAG: aspartate--tRNA(Asn) ligase [Thermoplasmatales archaeon]|nr:aspartate--tRNA(Asn) ligase [Candidatus Thermoplasmatota archaeon]MCL6003527.1 aspartate--tRNA(Asn) ligase [Candidatus Thermoplasmatota archaeon]MDA8055984.1 aspartate--tRNA(Asn) ligase [Thermoplasmatales archaeon]
MRILIREVKDRIDSEVEISGWVQNIRIMSSVLFIELRDVSGTVQGVLLKKGNEDLFNDLKNLPRESVMSITGQAVKSQAKIGYEVQIRHLEVLNRADAPLPLGVVDKIESDIETRLENRFLDLRRPETLSIFKVQSTIANSIRDYFVKNGFIEIHSPKIVAAATEGGTELFPVKYFERSAYLSQSPQLYKEIMMAAGFDKVFEVAPAFRAEEHNTPRHLNEFTSIDMEMSFVNDDDVMDVLESVIKVAGKSIADSNERELEILGVGKPSLNYKFKRITYSDYVKMANEKGIELKDGEDLSTPVFKAVGGGINEFYFITRWPRGLKPFYVQSFDEKYSRGFDLQFGELEITSGAQRVHSPDVLLNNLRSKGLDPVSFSFYVNAFKYGMPPHAGWAIGLERLTMVLLNISNIRETTLFPRDRTRVTP